MALLSKAERCLAVKGNKVGRVLLLHSSRKGICQKEWYRGICPFSSLATERRRTFLIRKNRDF